MICYTIYLCVLKIPLPLWGVETHRRKNCTVFFWGRDSGSLGGFCKGWGWGRNRFMANFTSGCSSRCQWYHLIWGIFHRFCLFLRRFNIHQMIIDHEWYGICSPTLALDAVNIQEPPSPCWFHRNDTTTDCPWVMSRSLGVPPNEPTEKCSSRTCVFIGSQFT